MITRILVADDSIDWSKAFCDFVNQRDYQATSVATGKELFNSVLNAPNDYDILIVDNSMPEVAGEEEIAYCGVRMLGLLVTHFSSQPVFPAVLSHVIIRSIYSRQDMNSLRKEGDEQTELGCSKAALWLDRNVPLDELMRAILRLSTVSLS